MERYPARRLFDRRSIADQVSSMPCIAYHRMRHAVAAHQAG